MTAHTSLTIEAVSKSDDDLVAEDNRNCFARKPHVKNRLCCAHLTVHHLSSNATFKPAKLLGLKDSASEETPFTRRGYVNERSC